MQAALRSQIALTMVPGLGPVHAKQLLHAFDIEELFETDPDTLQRSAAIPDRLLVSLLRFSNWKRVEEEMQFIERNQIRTLFITDPDYPKRLLNCPDAPILLYFKGQALLHANRMIAVVGTRGCTRHGVQSTEEIISQLSEYGVTIISGLAIGIDTVAHRSALRHGLETLAVLPLGLDAIYPAINRPLAREILRHGGGLLTESMSEHHGDAYLFPRRNRIVAGCCDAIIIVESGRKGGSLITGQVDQWRWQFDALSTSTQKDPPPFQFPFNNRESYYRIRLRATNLQMACSDSIEKVVRVLNHCLVEVPTAFTPNNDGLNDFFSPHNAIKANQYSFTVFNRWGQLVYQTNNWMDRWDGKVNGQVQPSGVYVWKLSYTHRDTGQPIFRKGTVTLVR